MIDASVAAQLPCAPRLLPYLADFEDNIPRVAAIAWCMLRGSPLPQNKACTHANEQRLQFVVTDASQRVGLLIL
jgi:hypothetical protein